MKTQSRWLLSFAWRDLTHGSRHLRVFWACLMLGVTLIAGTGGLHRLVSDGLLSDARALFGGDVRVDTRNALEPRILEWMQARARVSRLVELRTMMVAGEAARLIELQVVDDAYPLYGEVELEPQLDVAAAVSQRDGEFGAAIDPVLAERAQLEIGEHVDIGNLRVKIRAIIKRQPDRSLSADWRGLPVLISAGALAPSGLVGPGSRLEYTYRAAITGSPSAWALDLAEAFPEAEFEVRTFEGRTGRVAEVLGQAASVLLLIGFSALLVGGIGIFNSVRAHLDTKLATIAALRALGLRERPLACIYLGQVVLLAASAAFAGLLLGGGLALGASVLVGERLPVAPALLPLAGPLGAAWLFGVLIATSFALPAVGRALSVQPAVLFRGIDLAAVGTPLSWWLATTVFALMTAGVIVFAMPDPWFGIAFVAVSLLLMLLLEGLVRIIRSLAHRFGDHAALGTRFALRLALANLYRRGSPLRVTLLSLGSALTVLVAATVVVYALLETIEDTIPKRAPALVLYDIATDQVEDVKQLAQTFPSYDRLTVAPLVLGRLYSVNGERLRDSDVSQRALESRDEHKLSYRAGNIDDVKTVAGQWWPDDYSGPPKVAFEDREAAQLGLEVGDRLAFEIMGERLEAELAVIYAQRGVGTRFWFEGIFSNGAIDEFITRYVGTVFVNKKDAIALETAMAEAMPNIVSARTARILSEARAILNRVAAGLAVIAMIALGASLLVLASVIAASRAWRLYDAAVLHALGARVRAIRLSLALEYALVAVLTTLFAIGLGFAIATALFEWRIKIDAQAAWWVAACLAACTSVASLGFGAAALINSLKVSPAVLMRRT